MKTKWWIFITLCRYFVIKLAYIPSLTEYLKYAFLFKYWNEQAFLWLYKRRFLLYVELLVMPFSETWTGWTHYVPVLSEIYLLYTIVWLWKTWKVVGLAILVELVIHLCFLVQCRTLFDAKGKITKVEISVVTNVLQYVLSLKGRLITY